MKKFFKDFKAFISRGNILDMAVGVIIGGAFSAIVTAFTNKIIMPIVNLVLSLIGGGNGLESAYTFLKYVPKVDESGAIIEGVADLEKSIFIDWGAFIVAILNFLIIAMTQFIILKVAMNARGMLQKTMGAQPTRAERKELKAQGVDMKNHKEVLEATKALRASKVPPPPPPKPTTEELLTQILAELKTSNEAKQPAEEKPKTKTKKNA